MKQRARNRPGPLPWLLSALLPGLLLWGGSPAVSATEYQQKQGSATLGLRGVKVEKDRLAMRLSDQVVLSLTVEGPAGIEVESIQNPVTGKDWQISGRSPAETVPRAAERAGWRQTFRLRPIRQGELILAASVLRFREKADQDWSEIHWSPVSVQVSTEILNPDLSELRGITGPEGVPAAPSWWPFIAWAGVAVVSLALCLAGWSAWRRRSRRSLALPPDQWALRQIELIESWPRTTDAEVERFYTELCDVVRKYLELRFQLPALEQTTSEFFQTMRSFPQLTGIQQELLRRFLERCDLVKFARAASTPAECQDMVAMGRAIVQETAAAATKGDAPTVTMQGVPPTTLG